MGYPRCAPEAVRQKFALITRDCAYQLISKTMCSTVADQGSTPQSPTRRSKKSRPAKPVSDEAPLDACRRGQTLVARGSG
jgi:hypothetical protein